MNPVVVAVEAGAETEIKLKTDRRRGMFRHHCPNEPPMTTMCCCSPADEMDDSKRMRPWSQLLPCPHQRLVPLIPEGVEKLP
jgi:hypothetical protein